MDASEVPFRLRVDLHLDAGNALIDPAAKLSRELRVRVRSKPAGATDRSAFPHASEKMHQRLSSSFALRSHSAISIAESAVAAMPWLP